MRQLIAYVVGGVLLLPSVFSPASAEELPDKFRFSLGAYHIQSTDTTFSLNPVGGILGTNISFSRDLGGEDRESVPRIHGYYRFNDKHRLNYGWYRVERDARTQLRVDLEFGDETYTVGTDITSFINADIYELSYQYSFYHNSKVELGFSAGLFIMGYEVGIEESSGANEETADVTAPLPILGFHMDYAINPRWHTIFGVDVFFIEIGDEYSGGILDLNLATEYRLFENLSVGVGITHTGIDVSINDDDFRGNVNDSYKGYFTYLAVHF